jgi:hypothetical protein
MRERRSRHADAANDHNEQRQRHCEPRPNNPAAGKAMQASPRTSPLTNNALLVARCDFPRRHAELIEVPIADGHLDRGCHFLTATLSLGVTLPFGSQAFKLKLDCCIRIVDHDPSPHHAGCQFLLQTWRRVGVPLAQSGLVHCKQRDPPSAWVVRIKTSALADSRRKVAATKKNPKQFTHLGFGSLLPQNQASSAGRRVSGDGVPPSSA